MVTDARVESSHHAEKKTPLTRLPSGPGAAVSRILLFALPQQRALDLLVNRAQVIDVRQLQRRSNKR